jgi:hypothetical protein
MKIIYLTLATLVSVSTFAQKKFDRVAKEKNPINEFSPKLKPTGQNKITLWSNDFSNANDWIIANNTSDNQNWVISTSTSPSLGYGMGPWIDAGNSVSNENGYALFDSDAVGTQNGNQNATITYAGFIDLTSNTDVVLEFAQRVRKFTTTKTYVGVSLDSGATWTDFELNASKPVATTFEEMAQVNISSVAGGQDSVKIRFRYVGSWDYAWLVDDVKISVLPNFDIRALPIYFAGLNNLGIEYGRTPLSQLDDTYEFGGEVYNFGINDQTNIVIDGAFSNSNSALSYNLSPGDLASGDTIAYSSQNSGFAYEVGTYEGVFTVTSNEEGSSSPDFANNIVKRNFAITQNLYSQDAIGLHPQNMQSLGSLGSNSFQTTSGTIFSTYYDLRSNDNTIVGIEIGIGSSTNAGTEIQVSIIDTATFFADGSTPVIDANGFEALSEYYVVTANDVTNGKVTVYFTQPITLNSDGYFASVNTVPSDSTNIRILDDQTVVQPNFASMINILGDASYTNGNALAIRLLTGTATINETSKNSFELYPNPANNNVTIKLTENVNAMATILDLNGKVVKSNAINGVTFTLNTADLISGVYFVQLSNGNEVMTKKLIIQK